MSASQGQAGQGQAGLSLSSHTSDKTTFTKLMVPIELAGKSGQHPRKWGKERIANEVALLEFVRQNTTIPVPRVLSTGVTDQGAHYVTMERIENAVPPSDLPYECGREGHAKPCQECLDIAKRNAHPHIQWVQSTLAGFTSPTSGFNGVVIPPHFITQSDSRATWSVHYAPLGEDFVLMHGDLGPGNVMIDLKTLEFKAIIDWECTGFFPKRLAKSFWTVDQAEYYRFWDRSGTYIQALEGPGLKVVASSV